MTQIHSIRGRGEVDFETRRVQGNEHSLVIVIPKPYLDYLDYLEIERGDLIKYRAKWYGKGG